MTKALCTLAIDSHLELLEYSLPTFEAFAEQHGYELIVRREIAGDLAGSWEKVRLVRELLDDHEEVMWVDADAMIVDSTRDIFEDLPVDRGWGWAMHIYANTLLPNAGILALRSRRSTFEILDRVWTLLDRYATHPWWEQAAIMDVLGFREIAPGGRLVLRSPTPLIGSVQFLPIEWNSLAIDQAPAPRIKHYAGLSHELRLESMGWDRAALARNGTFPQYDLSVVLALHDTGADEALRCLESIAELQGGVSVQTVIVAPREGPLDGLLAELQGDVRIVRSVGRPDHSLVGGVSTAEGNAMLLAVGPMQVTAATAQGLCSAMERPGGDAILLHAGSTVALGVRRDMLPPTAWVGGQPATGGHPLDPALRALSGAGVPVARATLS